MWNSKFPALSNFVGYVLKRQEKLMEFVPRIIDYVHKQFAA